MSASLSDEYLTPKQLAERLGKSVGVVTQWRYHGRGPAWTKLGHAVLYSVQDVERWEREQRARAS